MVAVQPLRASCRQALGTASSGCRTSGTAPRPDGGADAVIGPQIHLLVLYTPPEPFDEDVVPPAAGAVHADLDAMVFQQPREFLARELASAGCRWLVWGLRYSASMPLRAIRVGTRLRPILWLSLRKQVAHHPGSGTRRGQMQLVDPAHQRQIRGGHRTRLRVGCRARHLAGIAVSPVVRGFA